MIAALVRWWHYACAWAFATWEFFSDPAIDLNTDFAPDFDAIERVFTVYVMDKHGRLVFRGPQVTSQLCKEEVELLFIDAGFRSGDIIITEIAA